VSAIIVAVGLLRAGLLGCRPHLLLLLRLLAHLRGLLPHLLRLLAHLL
jgi:hypothetical protein